MSLLNVKNLNVEYVKRGRSVCAVRNLSLSLEKGEVVGIVGESGSGKTTAMLALLGLLPDRAKITADEMEVIGGSWLWYSRIHLHIWMMP